MNVKTELYAENLQRTVQVSFFNSDIIETGKQHRLLLVNDGQDLIQMNLCDTLNEINKNNPQSRLLIAGVASGENRNSEYGMAIGPDYNGWGSKAGAYSNFVVEELVPFIKARYSNALFDELIISGFSLGGLSAFDIGWNHPDIFSKVGVFSPSFWWRSVDKNEKDYDPWQHRMMHWQVAQANKREGMKFFFECGKYDELEDRNRNGVIDSIDDTIDLMRLLLKKGYAEGKDFFYLQMPEGKHDVATWGKAFEEFLKWLAKN